MTFLFNLDTLTENFFYSLRTALGLRFFYFITLFAQPLVIIVSALILSIILWIYRDRLWVFALWFTIGLGESVTILAKLIFARARPSLFPQVIVENTFSFPSGHATAVVLFYGFLAYLILRSYYTTKKVRSLTLTSLIIFIILIDLSRLYLGVHYLSDVLVGNLVGFMALLLSIAITESLIKRHPNLIATRVTLKQVVSTLVVSLLLVLILYFSLHF